MNKEEKLKKFKDNLVGSSFEFIGNSVYFGGKVIGGIAFENDAMILLKRVDEKTHTLRKLDAWGFNLELMHLLPVGTFVFIQSEKTQYLANREKVLSYGEVMQFDGYEEQVFLPKKFFSIIPYKNKGVKK